MISNGFPLTNYMNVNDNNKIQRNKQQQHNLFPIHSLFTVKQLPWDLGPFVIGIIQNSRKTVHAPKNLQSKTLILHSVLKVWILLHVQKHH